MKTKIKVWQLINYEENFLIHSIQSIRNKQSISVLGCKWSLQNWNWL